MKSEREFTGTLLGFDDFVSECPVDRSASWLLADALYLKDMVLEDVTE